jgi:hypothetical protein
MNHLIIASLVLSTLGGVGLRAAIIGSSSVSGESNRQSVEREANTMGAEVSIYLFNLRTFNERILPAYKAYVQDDDSDLLIGILKEVIKKFDRGELMYYQEAGIREACEKGIEILGEKIDDISKHDSYSQNTEEKYTREHKQDYVSKYLIYPLVLTLCLPRHEGINPKQDLTKSPLVGYLSEKSEWLADFITFGHPVRGGLFELELDEDFIISLGEPEGDELFTKEDIQELSTELSKISPPAKTELKEEFDNFQRLLKLALGNPDFKLVLSVQP